MVLTQDEGRGRDAVPLAVELSYDFPQIEGYLGNVGLGRDLRKDPK